MLGNKLDSRYSKPILSSVLQVVLQIKKDAESCAVKWFMMCLRLNSALSIIFNARMVYYHVMDVSNSYPLFFSALLLTKNACDGAILK